jgi:hypothetical protein
MWCENVANKDDNKRDPSPVSRKEKMLDCENWGDQNNAPDNDKIKEA